MFTGLTLAQLQHSARQCASVSCRHCILLASSLALASQLYMQIQLLQCRLLCTTQLQPGASAAAGMVNGESGHAAGAGPSAAGAADFTALHEQGMEPAPQGAQGLQTPAEPMVPATTLAPGVDPDEAERGLIADTRLSQQGPSGARQKLAGRSIVADVPPSTDSRAVAAAYRYDWAAYEAVATALARLRLSRGLGQAAGDSLQGVAAAALQALGQGEAATGNDGGHPQARLTDPNTQAAAWGQEGSFFLAVGGDGEHVGQAGGILYAPAPLFSSSSGAAEQLSAAGHAAAAHPVLGGRGPQQQQALPPERECSEGSLGSLDIESPKPPPRKGRRRWGKDPVLRKSDEGAAEVQPLLSPTRSASSLSEDVGEAAARWAAPLLWACISSAPAPCWDDSVPCC